MRICLASDIIKTEYTVCDFNVQWTCVHRELLKAVQMKVTVALEFSFLRDGQSISLSRVHSFHEDAEFGTHCYRVVAWAKEHGLKEHPKWCQSQWDRICEAFAVVGGR